MKTNTPKMVCASHLLTIEEEKDEDEEEKYVEFKSLNNYYINPN